MAREFSGMIYGSICASFLYPSLNNIKPDTAISQISDVAANPKICYDIKADGLSINFIHYLFWTWLSRSLLGFRRGGGGKLSA